MIAPDPMLRCRPTTSPAARPCEVSSTRPYPVTSTCTTLVDTRCVSSSTDALRSLRRLDEPGGGVWPCTATGDAISRQAHTLTKAPVRWKVMTAPFRRPRDLCHRSTQAIRWQFAVPLGELSAERSEWRDHRHPRHSP